MKSRHKLYLTLLLVLAVMIAAAQVMYDYAADKLYDEAVLDQQQQTHKTIQALIHEQKYASMTLALSLAENPIVQHLLQPSSKSFRYRKKIADLVKNINQQPGFDNLWVQLIDVDGNSRYRSWTKKSGDSLLGVRHEIREILNQPEPRQVISVGKFTLSFKSMMPVFDDNQQLVGLVDVITQFTPLTEKLNKNSGIGSVLLTDQRYQKQLTKADSSQFLDGFLITNADADAKLITLMRQKGVKSFTDIDSYRLLDDYVVTRLTLQNSQGGVLAHWLSFIPQQQIDFEHAGWVLQKYVMISVAAILLLLLVVVQYVHNRQSQQDKQYYRQIIDSVADIVYITNSKRIVDVNQHFFEFYSEFENIDQFLKQYRCVCDTFVVEEGFLQREVQGQYWLEYVLSNPNLKHKAKIIHNGTTHIFQIKIKPMQGQKEQLYNVLMQDITQVEAYEKKLQKLTVTDELTGVGNRLACNETLSHEIQRSHRYNIPLSLIMMDIDFFKKVNDRYGHDVGDLVLKEVARSISKILRDADEICRFGGEEFLVVLPETNNIVATQVAERIRETIKDLTSTDVPSQITMSLGVTTLTKWDSEATLIKRADKALYQAKENGRDRVEVEIELSNR